ncbi:MAG: hypothetical protein J5636_02025 [Clostridiales bacterium]|nr:hypothetical protein [Clostridiales bacterium]
MERTTQLFTDFNKRLSKVCEAFADQVSSAEGPTEGEMAEHFKNFRSYIEQETNPFWKEKKSYLDGMTGEEFIGEMDMETALAAFSESATLIDDEATPFPLVERLKSFGDPACERLLKMVLDANWQPEEGEDENAFFVKFQPCVAAIRFFGSAEYEPAMEPVLTRFCSFPSTQEYIADSVKVMMLGLGERGVPMLIDFMLERSDADITGPYEDMMIMLTQVGIKNPQNEIYQALRAGFRRMKAKVIAVICIGDYGDPRGIALLKGYLDRTVHTIDRETFYEALSAIRRLGGEINDIQDPFHDFTKRVPKKDDGKK